MRLQLAMFLTRIRRKSFRTLSMKKPSLSSLTIQPWPRPSNSSKRMLSKIKMRSVKNLLRKRWKSLRLSRM